MWCWMDQTPPERFRSAKQPKRSVHIDLQAHSLAILFPPENEVEQLGTMRDFDWLNQKVTQACAQLSSLLYQSIIKYYLLNYYEQWK